MLSHSTPAFALNGFDRFATWSNAASLRDLYARRCRKQVEEMTCHRQAVDLLRPYLSPGNTLFDIGAGAGYFFHSLAGAGVEYFGLDASDALLEIGREILPEYGLPAEHLITGRIEDLWARCDHVVSINTLTYLDNYYRPLERMLLCADKTVLLRENIAEGTNYAYVDDHFLDPGVVLKSPINQYDRDELSEFIEGYGFRVTHHIDEYTGGKPQDVIGHPHCWSFLLAVKV
jgi:hypothetical protein